MSTKHIPMLCRSCHGPMTAKLYCSTCKKQGRMMAYRVQKFVGPSVPLDTSIITIDLTNRDDEAANIIKAGGEYEIRLRRWGYGGTYSVA